MHTDRRTASGLEALCEKDPVSQSLTCLWIIVGSDMALTRHRPAAFSLEVPRVMNSRKIEAHELFTTD